MSEKNKDIAELLEYHIKIEKDKLIEEFSEVLENLWKHANHSASPFKNLAWVKDGIKRERKKWEERLK